MNHTFRTDDNENGNPVKHESFSRKPPRCIRGSRDSFANRPSPIEISTLATEFVDNMRLVPGPEDRPLAHLAWMAFVAAQSARTEYGRLCALRELAAAVALIKNDRIRECLLDEQSAELTVDEQDEYESIVIKSLPIAFTREAEAAVMTSRQSEHRSHNAATVSIAQDSRIVRYKLHYRLSAMVAASIVIGLGSLWLRQTGTAEPINKEQIAIRPPVAPSVQPVEIAPEAGLEDVPRTLTTDRVPSTMVVEHDAPPESQAATHVISSHQQVPEVTPTVRSADVGFTWFNADALREEREDDGSDEIRIINSSHGTAPRDRRQHETAEENAEAALKEAEISDGPNSSKVAQRLAELSHIHFEQGRCAKAADLSLRQLDILQHEASPKTSQIMTCTDELAQSYLQLGRVDEAIPLFERLLEHYEAWAGTNDLRTTSCANHLAQAYLANKAYAKAAPLFQRLLRAEEVSGSDSLAVARICDNLALARLGLDDRRDAGELFARASAIRETVCTPGDPELAISANHAGVLAAAEQDYREARKHFEKSRQIIEDSLGRKHRVTAVIYDNLAKVHVKLGNLNQASSFWSKALAIRLQVYGPTHPQTQAVARSLRELQEARPKLDDLPEVEDLAPPARGPNQT